MLRNQAANSPLAIRLTEPITYLKSSATGQDFRGRQQWVQEDGPPAMLRGILTLRLTKPTRIKRIEVKLEGKGRTEWPEGIGPRRTETAEENVIIGETLTFFNAAAEAQLAINRRAMSVGPGIHMGDSYDVEEGSDEDGERRSIVDLDEDSRGDRGRGRNMNRTAPRSMSLMPPGREPTFSRMQSGDITSGFPRSSSPEGVDEASGSASNGAGPTSRHKANERFSQARGPSPAYALRDPLRENGGPARGRHMSPRRRLPTSDEEERDITDSVLSPIASVEGSRFPSPSGESPARRRTQRASSSSLGVRFDPVSGSSNGPSDSDDSSSADRPVVPGSNGGHTALSRASSVSQRSDIGLTPPRHIDGTASPHPLQANIFSAHPSTNNSRTSIQASASSRASPVLPLVEVTRSGSNRSSLVELTPAPVETGENGTRERRDSSSMVGQFAANLRHRSSQGSINRRTPSVNGSPAGSTLAVNQFGVMQQQNHAANGTTPPANHERGRKGGKFSIASALRSISRATSTSRTRQTSQPPSAPSAHYSDSLNRTSSSSHMDGRMQTLATEDREIRPFGRGGAARSPSRTRALSPVHSDRSDSRGRGRGMSMKALGLGGEDADVMDGGSHNWKEFKKGVYNYPISFPIPPNAPPTIHADFGSVTYRLTATVHRPGALSPNYIEDIEVCMVATPQEDDLEETENILVERQWEDQMRYLIALSGKAFTIGGQIPISIRIMPMSKCKIFRISAAIEEKIDYFAMERKVARHEAPKKYPLIAFKNADEKHGGAPPLLPIISESTDAIWLSPLAAMAVQARQRDETEDDAVAQLLNPFGPWNLETMLQVPDCPSRIKFSTKHDSTNMTISHWLKIVIRVQRGDDEALDSKGKRKQFDIIIETPLHLLDCRATTQNSSLPSYQSTTLVNASNNLQSTCRMHRSQNGLNEVPIDISPQSQSHYLTTTITRSGVSPNSAARRAGRSVSTARGRASESVGAGSSNGSEATATQEAPDTLLERNIVFDRLMSGQESEQGESPPTYDEALRNRSRSRNPRGRSGSRLRTEIC